ncbi:hypothetical protein K0M31_010997 [Melipona bicolor]|uniref:Uncharacterized protein n=1 Tax=Melipona bicolor TaxID=60889 RepID=A0AA40KHT7_9HYME|nr:hypothetical protein K0M31_010997 [Melipona bicolor]
MDLELVGGKKQLFAGYTVGESSGRRVARKEAKKRLESASREGFNEEGRSKQPIPN